MLVLKNKADFDARKAALDDRGEFDHYDHRHVCHPESYPCLVQSLFEDDPNGPYTYYHIFTYPSDVIKMAKLLGLPVG